MMASRPNPAISVVLPTFNGEAYVRESVDSVLAQDVDDFELVICDDASSDGTWALLQTYADPRIRLLRNEKNLGLFPTLNRLMRTATAPWVHLWSQDDRMLANCLRRTAEFCARLPDVGMVYSGVHYIDEHGKRLAAPPEDLTPAVISPLLAARIMFYFGSIAGNIANVTLSKSVFDALGGFREDLVVSGDFDYWVRACKELPIGFQNEKLIELRRHSGQFSRRSHSGTRFILENEAIHDELMRRMPPSEHRVAARYRRWFLQVKSFHHAVRCALAGNLGEARDVLSILQAQGPLAPMALRWFLSANGRLARPPRDEA